MASIDIHKTAAAAAGGVSLATTGEKHQQETLTITERDESGAVTAVITSATGSAALSVFVPEETLSYAQKLLNVFLPAGFPASVGEDYVGYQIYDSLQAFSSSIAGLLTSRAVLQGFGVGDANASATGALLLTIVQDSVSRLATIAFAYRFGVALEAECKKYRLAADIFNDSAMILDCLSPAFPGPVKIVLLCLAGALRAACGVAGGGSKASLSVHFAKTGNVGELNAKDSSQETVIGLMGMLAGSFVVRHITSTRATWASLMLLLALHLGTNYMAVSSVALRTLNRQRANIVFSRLSIGINPNPNPNNDDNGSGNGNGNDHSDSRKVTDIGVGGGATVVTPVQAARMERIFERDGVLRWRDSEVLGFARVGSTFSELAASLHGGATIHTIHTTTTPTAAGVLPPSVGLGLGVDGGGESGPRGFPTVGGGGRSGGGLFSVPHSPPSTCSGDSSSHPAPVITIHDIAKLFQNEKHLLWHDARKREVTICLKTDITPEEQLKAWVHALFVAKRIRHHNQEMTAVSPLTGEEVLSVVENTLSDLNVSFETILAQLRAAGWDLGTAALETKPGYRVGVCSGDAGNGMDGIGFGRDEAKKDR